MRNIKNIINNKKVVVLAGTLIAILLAALSYVYISFSNNVVTFRAVVVARQTDELDMPGIYILDNGKRVMYSCGFCPSPYEGKVVGSPKGGDTVEVKATKNRPGGADSSDNLLFIHEKGLYIKKIN